MGPQNSGNCVCRGNGWVTERLLLPGCMHNFGYAVGKGNQEYSGISTWTARWEVGWRQLLNLRSLFKIQCWDLKMDIHCPEELARSKLLGLYLS